MQHLEVKGVVRHIYRVILKESAILCEMIVCDSKQKSSYERGSDFEVDFALRLVAASLKICYETCQTSTSQGFVHCRSSVTQW
jgi:hypothetical protein